MRKSHRYIIRVIIIGLLILSFLHMVGAIGVNSCRLEKKARQSQDIDESYQVTKSISSNLGALLFYDEDLNDFTYSIFLNRKGLSFGYLFKNGGSIPEVRDGIAEFDYDMYGRALISLNKSKIKRMEMETEKGTRVIELDSEKPFSLAIPREVNSIKVFDMDDNIVETCKLHE